MLNGGSASVKARYGPAGYLRELLPYLSAKLEPAISAVKMIAGGPPKEVLDGERIALARIAKEDS